MPKVMETRFSFSDNFSEKEGGLYHITRWEMFCQMMQEQGFRSGYEAKFTCPEIGGFQPDTEAVFFNSDDGLVIYASSFGGEFLNQATMYGEIHLGQCGLLGEQKALLSLCERTDFGEDGIAFSKEIRKGFNHYIKLFKEVFRFHSPWTRKVEISLLNYSDKTKKEKDVQMITETKRLLFSAELTYIMNYK